MLAEYSEFSEFMVRLIIFLSLLLSVRLFLFNSSDHAFQNKNGKELSLPLIASVKEPIRQSFNKTLSGDQAALLLGIVFGGKEAFDRDFYKAFQKTGVLHVIAASGMNVSMVASFLLAILLTFLKRQYALIFTALAIFLYVALADFQPAIVRAAIMAVFAYGAGIIGRQNTALLALLLAAFIMIFWDPSIVRDLGFQLSFLATSGIILLDPLFKSFLRNDFWFGDLRTTLSAQIATVPIILFFFSSYALVSIPVNFLVLWTVPVLMAIGGAGAILSLITPILAVPILFLAVPFLAYFKAVVIFASRFPLEFEVSSIPWAFVVSYYFIILGLILWFYKRKKISL